MRHTLLALLLRAWQDEGFESGIGQELQLQTLLQRIPAEMPPDRLAGLLAPLLTKNEVEQKRFYALFEQCLEQAQSLHQNMNSTAVDDDDETEVEGKIRKWRSLAIAAAALLLIGFIGVYTVLTAPLEVKTSSKQSIDVSVIPGDTLTYDALTRPETPLLNVAPQEWQTSTLGYSYKVDTNGLAIYISSDTATIGLIDTAIVRLGYESSEDTIILRIALVAPPQEIVTPVKKFAGIQERPIPYPRDIGELIVDEAAIDRADWFQAYEWPLKILVLLLLAGLAWAILRWQQYRKAKVVAELQKANKAPYVWNPAEQRNARQWLEAAIQPLLRQFRGRAPDERQRLDIRGTIKATARKAGRIQMRYKSRSLPPEYLLLIDRFSADDHRAKLFDALYQLMKEAEVPVSRFFFQGDPRLCRNEKYPHGISLAELLHHHRNARLLIVGEGMGLLSPDTGRLAGWTSMLQQQKHKTLFSPRPRSTWGALERELTTLLPILPASPQGLQVALESFLAEEAPTPDEMLAQVKEAMQAPILFKGDLMADLRRHYNAPMLDWIAACAIWPSLSWDLTLMLGEKLATHHELPLLSFEGLRSLTRLPWFAQGRIPERARGILLDYLSERGLEIPMRKAIQEMLRNSTPPPADSVAYEDYRMNLIVNELLLKPDPATKRKLEREFAQYLAAGKKPDFVALRLLDRPATRLDALVGARLKKYAFKEGLPGLGWNLAPKLLGIWLLMALPLLLWSPDVEPCTGQQVEYHNQIYCLANAQDSLLYWQYLAKDAIEAQTHEQVDSLLQLADALLPKDSAFYLNTAARYFNYGAGAYNCFIDTTLACEQYETPKDSMALLACDLIQRGAKLDSIIYDSLRVVYQRALQRSCEAESNATLPVPQDTIDNTTTEPNTPLSGPFDTITTSLDTRIIPPLVDIPLPTMVRIPGGTFTMGCVGEARDGDCFDREKPAHEVTLSSFGMSVHEVTVGQYLAFVDDTNSNHPEWLEPGNVYHIETGTNDYYKSKGYNREALNLPIVGVSWDNAVAYAKWLSDKTGQNYRLPTEAEWEYAARGGAQGARDSLQYSGSNDIEAVAWYDGNSGSRTHEVGQKQPNQLGLYDMSGNVYEWVADWYGDYPADAQSNPTGPAEGSDRVYRGGSWSSIALFCRVAYPTARAPSFRSDNLGFRVALSY